MRPASLLTLLALLLSELSLTAASSRKRHVHVRSKTHRPSLVPEAGSCYAPDFACPDWAPCCSKDGFCGNTELYCGRKYCLAGCWERDDDDQSYKGSSEEDNRRYGTSRRRPSREAKIVYREAARGTRYYRRGYDER